jgi:hypothetical protein
MTSLVFVKPKRLAIIDNAYDNMIRHSVAVCMW